MQSTVNKNLILRDNAGIIFNKFKIRFSIYKLGLNQTLKTPKLEMLKSNGLRLRKIKNRISFFVFSIFLFFVYGLDYKETFAQTSTTANTMAPADSGGNDKPELTLAEVLRQVEANHPKLTGANIGRLTAESKLLEKRGAFDPVITTSTDFLRYNSTSTPGKPSLAFQNQGSVEWTTRSGMKFFAGSRLNLGRVKSPLSSTGNTGEYFAGVAMPLLRDRNINAKSIGERQASIDINRAETEIASVRLELFLNAATGYWEWAAANRKLEVNRRIFDISAERAKQVGGRVSKGDLPPIDSTEAAMEVNRRMGNVVKSEQELQKTEIKLGLYLWTPDGQPDYVPLPNRSPENIPIPNRLTDFIVQEGIKRALSSRPELQDLELMNTQFQLEQKLLENSRKPRVDLYLAPGQDTGPNGIGTTFKFGATLEIPVRNRTADGKLANARLKSEKILLEQSIERRRIEAEIRNAAQSANAAHDRYLLAREELVLAKRLEEGERIRFAAGDSTLFLVNQRERAAVESEIKLIEIQAEYEISIIAFKVAANEF